MFVYLLITLELGILYTVFWYLYLRDPIQSRRIGGNTWGSYNAAATKGNTEMPAFQYEQNAACASCYMEGGQHTHASAVKAFMVPVCDEMTLDPKTSHYVPLPRKRRTMLAAMIQQFDDCLSEFNVKP
ncbi:MAG: hypothetical protein K2X81_21090 [Candidatus Obscuribacterales bacterium]|nr:hypothetical protein [Candidatus Obscuribacterales bacterium]